MSFSKIPNQNEFFYKGMFTREMEKSLLHSLSELKFTNEWKSSEITEEAWNVARHAVNEAHQCHVMLLDVLSRKRFLQDRYKTFKKLCKHPGVQYDPTENFVYAENAVWKKLFKENKLYQAYRYAGEPEYYSISVLFGEDDVKIEFSYTVINISSSLPPPSYGGPTLLLSEEDEVTSPISRQPVANSSHLTRIRIPTRYQQLMLIITMRTFGQRVRSFAQTMVRRLVRRRKLAGVQALTLLAAPCLVTVSDPSKDESV